MKSRGRVLHFKFETALDMVFHWSVFTHLYIEECYIYLHEIMRSLKPGGRLVFSFLELEDERHRKIFTDRVAKFKGPDVWGHLDTFLHRDWIRRWAAEIGFTPPRFTDGTDNTQHTPFVIAQGGVLKAGRRAIDAGLGS